MIRQKKDKMWYVKSVLETIMMIIFMACLIGFIASWFVIIWNKQAANNIMGWSVGVGIINFLIILSCDKEWRRDYRDEKDADKFN